MTDDIKSMYKRTVWVMSDQNGEFVVRRFNGDVITSGKYKENVMQEIRRIAADPSFDIVAIASVVDPAKRKPGTNKPLVPARPL